jgi:hypothetical protein
MHPACAEPDAAWPSPTATPGRRHHLHAVTPAGAGNAEAWIEHVHGRGDSVLVALSLADGRPAFSVLRRDEAEWLELRAGQIVSLATNSPGDPRVSVLGQRVDLAGEAIARDVGQADGLQDAAHIGAQRDPHAL